MGAGAVCPTVRTRKKVYVGGCTAILFNVGDHLFLSERTLGSSRSVLCPHRDTTACSKGSQLETSRKRVTKKTEAHFWLAAFKTLHLCGRTVSQPDAEDGVCVMERRTESVPYRKM